MFCPKPHNLIKDIFLTKSVYPRGYSTVGFLILPRNVLTTKKQCWEGIKGRRIEVKARRKYIKLPQKCIEGRLRYIKTDGEMVNGNGKAFNRDG